VLVPKKENFRGFFTDKMPFLSQPTVNEHGREPKELDWRKSHTAPHLLLTGPAADSSRKEASSFMAALRGQ